MAATMQSVRSLFIPIEDATLLLPGTVVAEIVPCTDPTPPQDAAPDWYLGTIIWREQRIPLISFEVFVNGKAAPAGMRSRIVVLKGVSKREEMPYYAVLTRQIPRLVTVYEESIEPLDEGFGDSEAVAAEVLASGEPALIPNVDRVEQMLYDVLNP